VDLSLYVLVLPNMVIVFVLFLWTTYLNSVSLYAKFVAYDIKVLLKLLTGKLSVFFFLILMHPAVFFHITNKRNTPSNTTL
jgi:hypothetical protein